MAIDSSSDCAECSIMRNIASLNNISLKKGFREKILTRVQVVVATPAC